MTRWWRSHSVRVRLTIWYVVTMVVVLTVYAAAVLTIVRRNQSDALDQQLRRDYQWAASTIYQTPAGDFTWNEPEQIVAARTPDEQDLPWVQVWRTGGSELLFANSEARSLAIPASRQLAIQANGQIATVPTDAAPFRILSRRDSLVDETSMIEVDVVIQVARSESEMDQTLGQLQLILALGLPLAVLIAGLGGYALARRALDPVERMTAQARTITAEHLNARLPVANPDDEMGRLATVFNETLGRLEASFEQMRRFTADVSHELRTPLTSIRSVGEVGLRGHHRDEHAYRAIIGSMLEEADRLATLVDRLLTLSRAETGQAHLSVEPIPLRELAEDVVGHLGVLAEEQKQAIEVTATGTPAALGDRTVLRQALINLVDNAIKFSGAGGRIRIRLAEERGQAIVDVSDTGPGIPVDARERIFDRFFRATTGATGTGLGLSLARGAVEATGGRLTLESSGPSGSTFRITLPRATLARRVAV
ncbi:MAG: sensor histidine kinase [Vicinamibacterales bacterium]